MPIYQLTQPFEEYILELTRSKFVISPHGHGLDCYRTWEALLVNTIPIVKTSSLDALYTDLPVMIVKNWSEVTKEFLEEQYSIIKNKSYKLEKLYFNYWHDLIKAHKQTCLCARKF